MSAAGDISDNDSGGDVEEPKIVERTETVEVQPSDPPDEPARGDEPAPNRKQRREDRMRAEKEAREAAERQARETSERFSRLEQENARLRGFVEAQAQQRPQGSEQNDLNARVGKIRKEARAALERAAVRAKAGDTAGYEAAMDEYSEKLEEAAAERVAARMQPDLDQRFQQVQQGIPSPQMMQMRETVIREFPWMPTNRAAQGAVDALIDDMVAQGKPLDMNTIRAAATQVARDFKLGGQSAPTQQQRQRYAAPGGGEGSGGEDGPVAITMGQAEKKLAEATFRDLPAKEAHAKWASEMAKSKRSGGW